MGDRGEGHEGCNVGFEASVLEFIVVWVAGGVRGFHRRSIYGNAQIDTIYFYKIYVRSLQLLHFDISGYATFACESKLHLGNTNFMSQFNCLPTFSL